MLLFSHTRRSAVSSSMHTTGIVFAHRTAFCVAIILAFVIALLPLSELVQPQPALAQEKSAISIVSSTTTLTSDSDYTATFTVTNITGADTQESTLIALTQPQYTFHSASQLDDWAQGNARISTPYRIASVHVPALKKGKSTQVTFKVSAQDSALTAMQSWGAKPLLIQWVAGNDELLAQLHTFITRANDGDSVRNLPRIKFVVALPVSISNVAQCISNQDLKSRAKKSAAALLSPEKNAGDTSAKSATSSCENAIIDKLNELHTQYPSVQFVTDPALSTQFGDDIDFSSAQSLQPFGMDIAGITQANLTEEVQRITAQATRASAADISSTFAWQGENGWTSEALSSAASQGYKTAIATTDFTTPSSSAIHSSVLRTRIVESDFTILTAQSELSSLIQGNATSSKALAENSSAGQLNRLIAQSAFFEAQAPYEDRTVLISAADLADSLTDSKIDFISKAVKELSSTSWASLTDFTALLNAQSTYSSAQTDEFINEVQAASTSEKERISETVSTLATSRKSLESFERTILDTSSSDAHEKPLDQDPQALANGEISKNSSTVTPRKWLSTFYELADDYAAHSLAISALKSSERETAYTSAHQTITNTPYNAVNVSVPSSLHVVNESASVPVTVTNDLPVDIKIRVNAQQTGSVTPGIRIDSSDVVTLPAHNREQITLPVHATSGWTSTFRISLADANSSPVSQPQSIEITSSITILDNAGYAIFALALLLAILGVRRQMHRKKEPLAQEAEQPESAHDDAQPDAQSEVSQENSQENAQLKTAQETAHA